MATAQLVLEFYSGLGGLHYAAQSVLGSGGRVVEAFDINDTANDVYQHNFGRRPYQGNIEALTCRQLDRYAADMWLLSPPCQPYSRQGLQKQSRDARAASFITLLGKLPQLNKQPRYLLLENVVGFETSDTHADMLQTLHGAGYCTQGFILSPWQYGLPYSRPRYFCLAKKGHMALSSAREAAPAPGPCPAQATPVPMQGPGADGSDQGMPHHEVLHEPPYVLLDRMRGGPGTLKEVPPLSHVLLQQPCPTADVPAPLLPVTTPCASVQGPPQSPVDAGGAEEQQGGCASGLDGAGTAHTGQQDGQLGSCNGTDRASGLMGRREETGQQGSGASGMDVRMAEGGCYAAGSGSKTCHNSHKRVLSDSAAGNGHATDDEQPSPNKRSQQPLDSPVSQQPVSTSQQQPTTSPTAQLVPTHAHQGDLTAGYSEGQGSGDCGAAGGGHGASCWGPFMVPDKAMAQSGDVLDVVTGRSFRCKTFTKNYSQFMKGTGSVVCTAPQYQDPGLCTREAVHERAVTQHSTLSQPSPHAPPTAQQEPAPLKGEEQGMQPEAQRGSGGAMQYNGQQRPDGQAAGADAGGQGAGQQGAALLPGAQAGACGDEQPPAAGVVDVPKGQGHPLMSRLDKQVMATEWKRMGLRFFTPREVASLHGLPPSFTFPSQLSLRARYQLLGNSLCVPVVADLIDYLLTDSLTDPAS